MLRDFALRPPLEVITGRQILGIDRAKYGPLVSVKLDEKIGSIGGRTRLDILNSGARQNSTLLLELSMKIQIEDALPLQLRGHPQNKFKVRFFYNEGSLAQAITLQEELVFKLKGRFPEGNFGQVCAPEPIEYSTKLLFPAIRVEVTHEALRFGDAEPLHYMSNSQVSLLPPAFVRGIIKIFYGPDAVV